MEKRIEEFRRRGRELQDIRSALDLLSWDQEVMMPSAGGEARASQLSTIASILHQKLTDPSLGELLSQLSLRSLEDPWDRASLRELSRSHQKAVRIPESLVREIAKTRSLSYDHWVKAKQADDFGAFSPWLAKVFDLKREQARCLRSADEPLYDALHDEYEPGMTSARLDSLFCRLRPRLTGLLERIQGTPKPETGFLAGTFAIDRQEAFGRQVVEAMGFDWKSGRLDVSPHPFCIGLSPNDVRMTTHYSDQDLAKSLFGMIHECGHGLYEQGLPAHRYGQAASQALSLGLHESQSRMWENMIARSRPFWVHWYPILQRTFPDHFGSVGLDAFLKAVNLVQASPIRIYADEVSYGLHVILRYELEKGLIEGALAGSDIEQAWNERMEEYLGIRPDTPSQGVLQDTHWSQGLVGYFPTYLLGNLYGAQLFRTAQAELDGLDRRIARGDLLALRDWLCEKVHRQGMLMRAEDLVRSITGLELDADAFLEYLEAKYEEIYHLNGS